MDMLKLVIDEVVLRLVIAEADVHKFCPSWLLECLRRGESAQSTVIKLEITLNESGRFAAPLLWDIAIQG